jgi:uncharacterized protein involved in outer membrane biogenesis
MKRLLIIGAVVVVAVVVVIVVVLLNLGSAIKTVVERVGSDATKAKVTLGSAEVALTSGSGTLRDLTIGNPAGFTTDHAIRLGQISVTLDVASVNSNPIVVKEIVVGAPQIIYEFGAVGSNLDALKRNVAAYSGSGGSAPKQGDEAGGRRLVIENLYIRDGRVDVRANFLKDQNAGTTLPEIHLRDIGKQGGAATGASAAEITQQVIAAIANASRSAVGKMDVAGIQDALKGSAEEALKKGMGGSPGTTQGVQEGVKKLFGR